MAKSKHHESSKRHSKRSSTQQNRRVTESAVSTNHVPFYALENHFDMMWLPNDCLILRSRSTGEVYFAEV